MTKILIVEDNELNMKLFTDILTNQGYDICQAFDGKEAIGVARAENPDLILMDIQLPIVSGIDILKWIREDPQHNKTPILAVTAFAMKGDKEKFMTVGFQSYITKPIVIVDFLKLIKHTLNQYLT